MLTSGAERDLVLFDTKKNLKASVVWPVSLITALDNCLTTTPSLTTTIVYQSCSLWDSDTGDALALQFLHPKWVNKTCNCKSNSPFINFPIVVLVVVLRPYTNNGDLKIISLLRNFMGKHKPWKLFLHELFGSEIFFNGNFSDYLKNNFAV